MLFQEHLKFAWPAGCNKYKLSNPGDDLDEIKIL